MFSSFICWLSLFTTAKFTTPMFKEAKGKELLASPDPGFLKYWPNQPDLGAS